IMPDFFRIIKNETKQLHHELEGVSYAQEILSHTLTRKQYHELLLKNYYCYQRIESILKEVSPLQADNPISLFPSQRSGDLVLDLRYFDQRLTYSFPKDLFKIEVKSIADLIGVLYVLEGARLGGRVVVKMLRSNRAVNDLPSFHFFEQRGVNVGERWAAFRRLAPNYLDNNRDVVDAITAARQTFEAFHQVHQHKLDKLLSFCAN
ncbi:MAG: biliverdin-producing heme oxygenase, partial [Bacteroidota bacterium]